MEYPHERTKSTGPLNTIWPEMSTNGRDIDDCKNYLVDRGLSAEVAEESGWYPSHNAGDYFLRIVIPAITMKLGHVYWQARAVSPKAIIRYQTPKGPRHGALIYIAAEKVEPSQDVVVVEGPMDALAVAECGYDAVALMGMQPGDEAVQHLIKLVDQRYTLIVLDNEPVAQGAAVKLAAQLASAGSQTHVDRLKTEKDLATLRLSYRQFWLDERLL